MVLPGLGEEEPHGKGTEVSVGKVGVGDLYEVCEIGLKLGEGCEWCVCVCVCELSQVGTQKDL